MLTTGFLLVLVAALVAALTAILAFRKLAAPKEAHPISPAWIDELSVARYQPMHRLLDNADIEDLRSEPGFRPKLAAQVRRERIRIFRIYLKRLNADFASVCMAVKLVLLQSDIDRPDLAATLLRSQFRFAGGLALVYARLALYQIGIGKVEVGGLLRLFDGMRIELRSLTPDSAAWGS